MNKQSILNYLSARSQDFFALSDRIWDNAEIRFTEKKSAEDYAKFLEKEGFAVTREVGGLKTSLCATWGSGKPVIGFLGEYDALPGLSQKPGVTMKEPLEEGGSGHGCGHNLLGVGALIGAVGLKHHLESEGKKGTVIFFGCPAEEGGSGKTFMAREGCFNELDCAFCWHPAPLNMMCPGPLLATCTVRYSFTGKTSHAAAAPEMGRSALDAIELMNVGIQFLREHVPQEARIHYALTDTGGISPNIVPAHASGLYQFRAPYSPVVSDIYERVNKIAQGAALMTETDVKIEFLRGSSNTVLIPALDEIVYKNMCEIPLTTCEASDYAFAEEIVKSQVAHDKLPAKAMDTAIKPYNKAGNIPLAGSSDVGDVSWVCPVSQFGAATWPVGTAAHTWQSTACGKSDFAHRGMLFAGQVIAASAIDACESPRVIAEAWEQFRERTHNMPYHCPIPEEVSPEYLADALK